MAERRATDRRSNPNTPAEPISRNKERRSEDRRDSPRYAMTFLVRDANEEDALWEEREGDLSLGGIHWQGKTPPHGMMVEVRFRLPGVPKELRAKGEIIRLVDAGKQISFHVRFTDMDVQSELAVAKYLDDQIASGAQPLP